ncbi:MAG TPA: ABC transporter ATP-binding protein [Alphaproteobacteria bacterium]|nr:ABC transporter ATP-binding protein [Alphaproteobacteria bacterium]
MEQSMYKYVLKYSPRETATLIVLTLLSLPIYYVTLDIPKNVFNQGILAKGIKFPYTLFGYELNQVEYLFWLCFLFFLSVLVNGGLKQYINTYKGRLGERLLRRLRYELVSRIMRFPLPHFRKVSAGELIPMITAEVEPLGGYFGDCFAQPLIQIGTLGTIVAFLFIQNPIVGIAAISLYPIQGYIIPKMQRRVNQLGKERVRSMRKVSERIGEAVAGAGEIHANGTTNYERADFAERLGRVFQIRFDIYLRKGQVKFLNNFLNQMAPLLFYSIGGYLVIKGQLSAGALAAALTANKDMSAPWKELLDYYQSTQDSRIKYEQVTEQFRPENMFPEALQEPLTEPPPRLEGDIVASNLSVLEDGALKLLDSVTLTIPHAEKVAIVGRVGGGKEAFAMALARLYLPSGGKLMYGDKDASTLSEAVIGARVGYAGQSAYLFSASVRDNLTYGLRQRVVSPRDGRDAKAEAARRRFLAEARRAGNLDLDAEADWLDLATAGIKDKTELTQRMTEVLKAVDMEEDVFQLGLRGTIDAKARADVAERVLAARRALVTRLSDPKADSDLKTLIEPFHPDQYNTNATVAENLLFGTPLDPSFETDRLAENPAILAVLDRVGLTEELVKVGRQLAETMVELFADLPPGHEFFEQFSFISYEDLPEFKELLQRTGRPGAVIEAADRIRLMSLPFKLIQTRHRLDLLDDHLKQRILEARKALRESDDPRVKAGIDFFHPDTYNATASIQDNILFGKIAYGQAKATQRVGALIEGVVKELDLRTTVIEIGLDFQVGVAGARLAPPQRQKLAIARCLLKRPDILIVNEATAILDAQSQNRIMEGVFQEIEGRTLVWVLHNPTHAGKFDRVLVVDGGKIAEAGPVAELERPGTHFSDLLAAAA